MESKRDGAFTLLVYVPGYVLFVMISKDTGVTNKYLEKCSIFRDCNFGIQF